MLFKNREYKIPFIVCLLKQYKTLPLFHFVNCHFDREGSNRIQEWEMCGGGIRKRELNGGSQAG
jgi:hypothetical protein